MPTSQPAPIKAKENETLMPVVAPPTRSQAVMLSANNLVAATSEKPAAATAPITTSRNPG